MQRKNGIKWMIIMGVLDILLYSSKGGGADLD